MTSLIQLQLLSLAQTPQTYAQAATPGQYGGYPPSTYQSGGNYGYSDPQHYAYSHQHYYTPQPPANLPKCKAIECANSVHWEPDVEGDFLYCSPKCRDEHLLPIEKDKLKKELEDLAEKLRAAAVADVSNRPKHTTPDSGK